MVGLVDDVLNGARVCHHISSLPFMFPRLWVSYVRRSPIHVALMIRSLTTRLNTRRTISYLNRPAMSRLAPFAVALARSADWNGTGRSND